MVAGRSSRRSERRGAPIEGASRSTSPRPRVNTRSPCGASAPPRRSGHSPVARIVPVERGAGDARLRELESQGLLRLGSGKLPRNFWKLPRGRDAKASVRTLSPKSARAAGRFSGISAIVPLCVSEPATPDVRRIASGDTALVVWWATRTECVSAFARRRREGRLAASAGLVTRRNPRVHDRLLRRAAAGGRRARRLLGAAGPSRSARILSSSSVRGCGDGSRGTSHGRRPRVRER
jgi:hypothetical protein